MDWIVTEAQQLRVSQLARVIAQHLLHFLRSDFAVIGFWDIIVQEYKAIVGLALTLDICSNNCQSTP